MSEKYLTFVLPMPPSVNHIYRRCRGKVVLTEEARKYSSDVAMVVNGAAVPDKGRLSMGVHLYFPDRRGDIDNPLKVLIDSLAKALGFNDRRIDFLIVAKHTDKANPRAEVNINW